MADEGKVVKCEIDDNGIGLIKLDHPKANALSRQVLLQLRQAASHFQQELPKAVVIHGGEKIFAAGADISEFGGPAEALEISSLFHSALDSIAEIPRITIAAINGYALGGGLELALSCDFRVASSDARMGQPEILLGIIPGGGGTQRLARLIGVSKAKEIIFSGRQVTAEDALGLGIVDRVCEPKTAFEAAYQWALEFSKGPVIAHGLAKEAIDAGLSGNLKHGLDLEKLFFAKAFMTNDAQVGVASFLAQGPGKAVFDGR
ncbi:MAG: enoyl-CoA hydratase/isomerase family protein [Actinobacteria bacterium]|nr:enoyl-CoA hydratase/isomerase family protein [Actinomycetota bacterium]